MELGGKDPAIVCHDADVDHAVGSLVWGAFANAGQVCASVERAYIHESIYDEVVKKVVDKVNSLKMGDPLLDGISMGPMTDPGQLQQVIDHVEMAKQEGATILTGGEVHDGAGQFYPPTVMVGVNDEMECVREETFGPTLPMMKFTDEQDAIRRANNSKFGLNAYVFTTDKERGRKIAEQLEAGTVMINEVLMTHALPETPWGGVKESGMGRVHGDDGFLDLCIPYHVNYDRMRQPAWSPFWQPYTHTTYRALKNVTSALFGQGIGGRFGGLASMLGNASVAETQLDSSEESSQDQASLN
jgi:succinate-semialdehyde dehydrogenase/glutarate-semialdehyde dehydrogenase